MELKELLGHIILAFDRLEIPYFIIGTLASMFYGEPRFTNDAGIVADMNEHHIAGFAVSFSSDEFVIEG